MLASTVNDVIVDAVAVALVYAEVSMDLRGAWTKDSVVTVPEVAAYDFITLLLALMAPGSTTM